jgi:hypothetical protein
LLVDLTAALSVGSEIGHLREVLRHLGCVRAVSLVAALGAVRCVMSVTTFP